MTVSSLICDFSKDLTFAWSYWRTFPHQSNRYRRLFCSTHWYRKRCSRLWSPLRSCTSSPPVPPRPCSRWWSHPTLKYQHVASVNPTMFWPLWCVRSSSNKVLTIFCSVTVSTAGLIWAHQLRELLTEPTEQSCVTGDSQDLLAPLGCLTAHISVLCQVMTK